MSDWSFNSDMSLEIALDRTAVRMAKEGRPVSEAAAALRTLAGGRGDLLAAVAGDLLVAFLKVQSAADLAAQLRAAASLLRAGAEPSQVVTIIDHRLRPLGR